MKKRDIILLGVILFICLAAFLVMQLTKGTSGNTVRITVGGEIYGEYSISEDRTIRIETEYGVNVVTVEGGSVSMTEADCPDGYCIDQGSKNKEGQSIVCLPHKVVVEVVETDDGVIDGVAN